MAQKPTSTSSGKGAKAPAKAPLRARMGLPESEAPRRRMQVNVLAPGQAEAAGTHAKVPVRFRHEATPRFGAMAAEIRQLCLSDESIFSASLERVTRLLRDTFGSVDQNSRKDLLAALVKHIAELQDSGALKRVPSDRIARVVSLVGDAAALVRTPSASTPHRVSRDSKGSALPPLFGDRTADSDGTLPTALQWYDTQWRPLIEEGGRAGDDIRQHDLKFYEALASSLRRRGQKLSDILPPSPTRSRKGPTEKDRLEHKRALNRESVRRYRSKDKGPK